MKTYRVPWILPTLILVLSLPGCKDGESRARTYATNSGVTVVALDSSERLAFAASGDGDLCWSTGGGTIWLLQDGVTSRLPVGAETILELLGNSAGQLLWVWPPTNGCGRKPTPGRAFSVRQTRRWPRLILLSGSVVWTG